MHAVRRTLSTAGLVGILVLAPMGAAFAATPTPDPSASATASSDPTPTASPPASPSDSPTAKPTEQPTAEPTVDPTSGCEQDPRICQSGGRPETTTDCDPFAASPPPSGVVCIAGGIRPGTTAGNGAGNGAGTPGQLPRTGPAPLLPTVTVGMWLVLLGLVLALAGRRRIA